MGGSLDSSHGDFARAGQITDAKGVHKFEEFADLAFVSGDFDCEPLRLNIHNFGSEDVAYLHHFRPIRRVRIHAKHDQLTIDILTIPKILNFNDINELIELLCYLLKHGVIAAYNNRHPGCRRIIGGRDIQTIDVESASAEHSGDPGKDAELVFDQNRYRVTHNGGEESSRESAQNQ